MRIHKLATVLGMIALFAAAMAAPKAMSQEPGVQSLRGTTAIDEAAPVEEIKKQATERRFPRAYRQQPPLIPHKVEKYQINLKVNQCLRCHDWPYNVDEGAPKISETHYVSRDRVALDKVARTRWFCTQCHVPQVRARAKVANSFRSSYETD